MFGKQVHSLGHGYPSGGMNHEAFWYSGDVSGTVVVLGAFKLSEAVVWDNVPCITMTKKSRIFILK